MNNLDQHISNLWESARSEAPHLSASEVLAGLELGTAAAASSGLGSELMSWVLKFKTIIMSSIVIVSASVLWSVWPMAEQAPKEQSPVKLEQTQADPQTRPQVATSNTEVPELMIASTEPEEREHATQSILIHHAEPTTEEGQGKSVLAKQQIENSVSQDTLKQKIRYVINNNTSLVELDAIAAQARKAGITFTHTTKGEIRKIDLRMSLDKKNGATEIAMNSNGDFEFVIGWYENEQGEAIAFLEDDDAVGQGLSLHIDIPGIPDIPHLDHAEPPVLQDGEQPVMKHIDRSTTKQEIEAMKRSAAALGIELEIPRFKAHGKRLILKLRHKQSQHILKTQVSSKQDPLVLDFGWVLDADGKFVRFLDSETVSVLIVR